MEHRTHKRFIRELPMGIALAAANNLACATVDFVLETKPACRSRTAYLSCHFEETLDAAIRQVAPLHSKGYDLADARLGVAVDAQIVGACQMPQGHPTHCGCLTRKSGYNTDPEKTALPRTRRLGERAGPKGSDER